MSSMLKEHRLERRAREIVESLRGHWSRGKGMCCCPAHDDRTPSLSVSTGLQGSAHVRSVGRRRGCEPRSGPAGRRGERHHGAKGKRGLEPATGKGRVSDHREVLT